MRFVIDVEEDRIVVVCDADGEVGEYVLDIRSPMPLRKSIDRALSMAFLRTEGDKVRALKRGGKARVESVGSISEPLSN